MPEFEPFLNGFRSLSLFICIGGFRLAVSDVGLVIAMLFGFCRFYRARVSTVGFHPPGR
jgi:hypothetical protein